MSVPEQFAHPPGRGLAPVPARTGCPPSARATARSGIDNWRIEGLRGLGPYAEVWDGYDDQQPELSPACLKFVTDPKSRDAFQKHIPHLKQVLDLEVINGLIPLRSAFVLTSPPCLEYVHLPGYDLANVMHDARWKNDRPRPEQAALIAKRVARVVGKLHRMNPPIVHRGLKPSNVLLCPTNEGRVSIWVSDVGWGQITAAIHGPGRDWPRRSAGRCAAATGRCTRPRSCGPAAPPDPRDDVYAIGMIWYQLLVRDPVARPPAGETWAGEFRRYGLTDGQARLIMACLAEVPADRPGDGQALADLIAANMTAAARNGDSATIRLRGTTAHEVKKHKSDADAVRLRLRPTARGRGRP